MNNHLSENEIHNIFMQAHLAIGIYKGADYTIGFANELYLQILDSDKSIVGKPIFEVFPELINQGVKDIFDTVMQTKKPCFNNEYGLFVGKDTKNKRFFDCSYQLMKDNQSIMVVFSEITKEVIERNKNVKRQQKLLDELSVQNKEKEKRANELLIANKELEYQNSIKEKRAAELVIANKELAFQNDEKEKRAAELVVANKELAFQNQEKQNRADELIIANKELLYQNQEKQNRADELVIANKELLYQNQEKQNRADELAIANKELLYQNDEKQNRANELGIANIELAHQQNEKSNRADELHTANIAFNWHKKEAQKQAYSRSLIEASRDPLFTIDAEGTITDANKAAIRVTGISENNLIGSYFYNYFTEPQKARKIYKEVFKKGFVSDYPLTIKDHHFTDVLFNGSVYKDENNVVIGAVVVARDITEQKKIEQNLLEYKHLFNANFDFACITNADGFFEVVNKSFEKVLGYTEKELLNNNFLDFLHPEDVEATVKEVKDLSNGHRTLNFINRYMKKNGDYVMLDWKANFNPTTNKIYAIARDITTQNTLEKELIEAKVFAELATSIAEVSRSSAEDAMKSKQQFLSNMSHEIRTPMNAIIGFTKVVLKTELTAKQKEYLMAIKMSGDSLIVLINDILDLAKVDSGKMTFENTPFKLSLSIKAMLHLFETKIQEKNLTLITNYDNAIPEVLLGDSVRLHQIILNLVSNAVKFTNEGSITVNLKLLSEDDKKVSIQFSVIDTGIGIKASKTKAIFEIFQQATDNTSRLFGGTGLGLAIVKQLVEGQNGTITLKSKENKGSTFSFTLDFLKTNADAVLEPEILELNTDTKNIKILVVEDMELNQLLMKTLLDDFGFDCDISANGKLAIEKLQNNSYDIILMDLQMPEMNGFEATEYIRKTMKLEIPIIALTADVTTVDVEKCREVGMNDYISKPVDERLLYSKLISFSKKPVLIIEHVKGQNPKTDTIKYVDMSYLEKLTKSEPNLKSQMITAYLKQTPPLIEAMKKSLIDKDWKSLQAAVHKMIPSFTIIGLSSDIRDIAKKIQEYAYSIEISEEIHKMVLELEKVCSQSCDELEVELNKLKN